VLEIGAMVLQTRDILASLLVLFLILEAAVTSPTHLLNETSSEDTDAANVTNLDLKEQLTSEEAFCVDLLAEGRSGKPSQIDLQRKIRSEQPSQFDPQNEGWSEDDLQEERISEEHSEDDLQERVGSNDVSFFVRLLNTIKSFRDGFSPRETQRKV
jgi:hypothetical protein